MSRANFHSLPAADISSAMWKLLPRLLCFNHDYGIAAEPNRIFLRCAKCGHRTTGWTLGSPPNSERERHRRFAHRVLIRSVQSLTPGGRA